MTSKGKKINVYQVIIGFTVLAVGTLVYLVDRPPDHTYFVTWSKVNISLYNTIPNLFGAIGKSLPTFAHAFAFILLTTGILSSSKSGGIIVTIFWFVTDSLFEIGQKYGGTIASFVPGWFSGIPFLENTKNYFQTGTFDWKDMGAILGGSLLAYCIFLITLKPTTPHS